MNGDVGGECSYGEQQIEHDAHDIFHDRHRTECLLEDIGQGDEDERGTAVGLHTHREGCRKDDKSGEDGYQRIDGGYLYGGGQQAGLALEIAGIGAKATHGNAE